MGKKKGKKKMLTYLDILALFTIRPLGFAAQSRWGIKCFVKCFAGPNHVKALNEYKNWVYYEIGDIKALDGFTPKIERDMEKV